MEGITYPEYRKIHNRHFPEVDEYYAPFLSPGASSSFKPGYLKKHYPDVDYGIKLVPQLLANNSGAFSDTAEKIKDLGYSEVNLNAGCPSGTVFAKYKGAGMLRDLSSFKAFLDGIYEHPCTDISVKTRMGVESTEEFEAILEIYNDYPISLLTIHARDRKGMYSQIPDFNNFRESFYRSDNPVCYNGNIFNVSDYISVTKSVPELDAVMIGRGEIANPALARMIKGGNALSREELKAFLDELLESYIESGLSARYACERMKGLWIYMSCLFADCSKAIKRLNKSTDLYGYNEAVRQLFDCEFDGASGFERFEKIR